MGKLPRSPDRKPAPAPTCSGEEQRNASKEFTIGFDRIGRQRGDGAGMAGGSAWGSVGAGSLSQSGRSAVRVALVGWLGATGGAMALSQSGNCSAGTGSGGTFLHIRTARINHRAVIGFFRLAKSWRGIIKQRGASPHLYDGA